MKIFPKAVALLPVVAFASIPAPQKTLIDYFQPIQPHGVLSRSAWGAANVLPRDPKNGLEDPTLKSWNYWDGQIIKGPDHKYHLFASRWEQAKGHNDWWNAKAIQAVSDKPDGPYVDQGLLWPDNQGGKGCNVTALVLPDHSYAVIVSETRNGDVFVSKSINGPFKQIGSIKVDANGFDPRDAAMSNVFVMLRRDGRYELIARSGAIMISKSGILGPYKIQGPSIYASIPGLPKHNLEDPTMWFSGGLYHIVVNCWSERKAYHLTSENGIDHWSNRGLAYDPNADFIRYTDGTVNRWNKIERPSVLMESGHVAYFMFSVIDVPKDDEKGNDGHGSKLIVVPFNGKAFDQDNERIVSSRIP